MRAAVLWEVGEALEVRDDVELADPGPGEVRVRIAVSGICHSDVSIQDGSVPQPLPSVLGHEGAGEVVALGDGVERVRENDHVVLIWSPPCGYCPDCLGGQPNLCLEIAQREPGANRRRANGKDISALAGLGTFAEEVIVPQEAVIPIPADIPFDAASLLGCGVMTGAGAAINTAKVQPGSSVAVIGCGGVGISVIQGARICGAAEIVAVDIQPEKIELAKSFGATHGSTPDQLSELSAEITGGRGFDYVFEALGRAETVRAAYDATRRGGAAVIVGLTTSGATVEFGAIELPLYEKKILGSLYGSADVRRDVNRLLRLYRTGRLDLDRMISRRINLKDVNDGMETCARGIGIRSVIEFD